ncbi:uncharacterized protein LOC144623516 [Crassostrea virginica]
MLRENRGFQVTAFQPACLIEKYDYLSMCKQGVAENLALLQSAWQSGTWRSNTGAERAVDGLYTNLREWGGECAASSLRQTATEWRVDLGVNRVYTTSDTNYNRATIPNPVNIACPYHGRYVISYNNKIHLPYPEGYSDDAWIGLCEVEVYGRLSPGYYGENCSLECPQNCQDCYWDIVGGTCFGCTHRYIGPRCEDCSEGLYGRTCLQNCSLTCGDPGRCDIMTGHCNGVCQVGWTGAMCDKECPEGLYGRNCLQNTKKNITCFYSK